MLYLRRTQILEKNTMLPLKELLIAAVSIAITGCPPAMMNSHQFHKILFQRDGGGHKVFFVSLDKAAHMLHFQVTKLNFRDTSYVFSQALPEDDITLKLIDKTIGGQVDLAGDYRQPQLPTGTWLHIYAVTPDDSLVEITNRELRDGLMALEQMVENQQEREGDGV
jgi:hypothetical protein